MLISTVKQDAWLIYLLLRLLLCIWRPDSSAKHRQPAANGETDGYSSSSTFHNDTCPRSLLCLILLCWNYSQLFYADWKLSHPPLFWTIFLLNANSPSSIGQHLYLISVLPSLSIGRRSSRRYSPCNATKGVLRFFGLMISAKVLLNRPSYCPIPNTPKQQHWIDTDRSNNNLIGFHDSRKNILVMLFPCH